jgi:hypothetical protein
MAADKPSDRMGSHLRSAAGALWRVHTQRPGVRPFGQAMNPAIGRDASGGYSTAK